ncbi:glutamate--tRNA ligase [Pseudemcibacter aquimaris]|uniref:glutamate--tRNA ligase n=1 Tax=Pseudemcibacter aquimaris TaxID=2857064 RepID=UPI00201132BB|nr:glutamate--tRNA ligase [Pseudemcibacter aquimaris]MCC3860894.1 glutamate--tRNA ligase [Pseudemcibacter aquimaris]WDU59712.1 glutamate--tRNA ligase [Pseudemcibacter aquimaris]
MKKVVTRFAPSPTGFLHIGGARTALFNWLFTRHHGGEFRIRVEDTDRKRSTPEAVDAIFEGLDWLGLIADNDIVFQYANRERHAEVALKLLEDGKAYKCYASKEELAEMRETAKAEGRPLGYDGRWRDRDPSEAPEGVDPVIRFKAPREGEIVIKDHVQGDVVVQNKELDDMILLRADGTPTYMLSVVVDDYDMGVTHVIRGDDHLTNAARQAQLINAIGWPLPEYAHIPLIHGPDGAKLSKRHGALGVDAYRDMGYLPDAVKNYLLRLGWAHGDEEVISEKQAIEWFDLDGVGKSPSRFDFTKLENMNGIYMREFASNATLATACLPFLQEKLERELNDDEIATLENAISELKNRAKNLIDLAESAKFLFASCPLEIVPKAAKALNENGKEVLAKIHADLTAVSDWNRDSLQKLIEDFVEREEIGFGKVAQPLRAALTGSNVSPGISEVLDWLGKDESLTRIKDQL